jgi:hypothetical protein
MSALYSHATGSRPVCVHCGAKYGQRHTHDVTLKWAEGEPEAVYDGYLQIVRSEAVRKRADGASVRHIDVWDGKSWMGGYEPFCTLRCALSYARKAYAARTAR